MYWKNDCNNNLLGLNVGRIGHVNDMLEVLADSFNHRTGFMVSDIVLGTILADNRTNGTQVAMVHSGEHMMLDLQVQSTSEPEDQLVVHREGMRSHYLVNHVVARGLGDIVLRQMVHLSGEHEEERVKEHGNNSEGHLASKIALEGIPLPTPQSGSGGKTSKNVHSGTDRMQFHNKYRSVQSALNQGFDGHGSHIECTTQGPDNTRREQLELVQRLPTHRLMQTNKGRRMSQIRVTERYIRIGVMPDDMLMIPHQRGRCPRRNITQQKVDSPVRRYREMHCIMNDRCGIEPRKERQNKDREP